MGSKIANRSYAKAALIISASCATGLTSIQPVLAFVPDAAPKKSSHAFVSTPWQVGIRTLRPELKNAPANFTQKAGQEQWSRVETDARSAKVRTISGTSLDQKSAIKRTNRADFVQQALAFIDSHKDVFGISSADVRLNEDAVVLTKENQFFKFSVWRDGLKVEDSTIDFRFKFGRLVQVINQGFGEAASDQRASVGQLDARAKDALIAQQAEFLGESYRVVEQGKSYSLVRVSRFAVSTDRESFVVSVENATGEIFEVRPTKFKLDGSAQASVYPRYYAETAQTLGVPFLNLTYGLEAQDAQASATVTTDANGFFTGAPSNAQPKLAGFVGSRVKVSPATVNATGSRVGDAWNIVWQRPVTPNAYDDGATAQSMAYYHLNKIIMLGKQYLPNVTWFNRPLQTNVNINDTCNAYWDGTSVNFFSAGDECANTGLIADVMYHEWGHGLDANTGGIDDGAFSEGFGDIMSMMITHSNLLGIGFRTNGAPVRDLEPDRIYPRDRGEEHAEGLIIGSTFWDLFKALRDTHGEEAAGKILEKYAFLMIPTATKYTDVYQALLVIDDDNGNLGDKTPNYCLLNKTFAAHGLATTDASCNLASLESIEVLDQVAGNGNGVIEPGEIVQLAVTTRNDSASAVNNAIGKLSVVNAPGITVTDANLAWDVLPANSSSRSNDHAVISVDSNVACGQKLSATIQMSAGNRTATLNRDLFVGRLDGQIENFAVSGLPKPINDNSTTKVSVIADSAQWEANTIVQSVRLKFDLTHTYIGDVSVVLVAPNGTSKEVFHGSGSTHDAHFNEDVTAAFAGVTGRGTWELKVTDSAAQDQGTLDTVNLELIPARFVCQ